MEEVGRLQELGPKARLPTRLTTPTDDCRLKTADCRILPPMDRRTLFKSLAAAPALLLGRPEPVHAQLPRGKITRVRIYTPPTSTPSSTKAT